LDGNRFENYAESKYKAVAVKKLKANVELERVSRSGFKVKGTDVVLTCFCDVCDMTQEDTMRQVLFES
jgi:hypothetical protein